MQVLFVHGMGRSPLSGWPLLRRLRQAGATTSSFGYAAAFENFDSITARLTTRIVRLAAAGDYVLVGHSLGGVLLRAALNAVPAGIAPPQHVYLLGSPMRASRLAVGLKRNVIFRAAAGDCGQLLASPERMSRVGPLAVPATGIAGVRGIRHRFGPFGMEPNDGVVALSEVSAPWLSSALQVPVIHTLLPSSGLVASLIVQAVMRGAG
jgi:pimeloyl-ACP methyl ester carboxylesterase